jgi:hypothetical protein
MNKHIDKKRGKDMLQWNTHIFQMHSLWFCIPNQPWCSCIADRNPLLLCHSHYRHTI